MHPKKTIPDDQAATTAGTVKHVRVVLPVHVYRALRHAAVERDVPVGEIITEAARRYLSAEVEREGSRGDARVLAAAGSRADD